MKTSMTIKIGPHQRASKRRRRWKVMALAVTLITMLCTMSLAVSDRKEPEPKQELDMTRLTVMRNEARLSPGLAAVYAAQYPEWAWFIVGE